MEKRTVFGLAAVVVAILCALNFGIWLNESLDLGGNAVSGKVRDGHYFVENKGRYREVTQEEWEHSRLHTETIILTQPLMLTALGYLAWTLKKRSGFGL